MNIVRSSRLPAGILFVTAFLSVLVSFEREGRGDNEAIKLAKAHFEVGAAQYRQGRYRAALKEFETSYQLSKKAALLFNMAQCYERLGNLKEAIYYRKKYLASQPNAPNRSEVTMQIRALQARLAATSILLVGKLPKGARIMVDGKTTVPGPDGAIRTSPGSHQVSIHFHGDELFHAAVALAQGQQLRLPLTVRRRPRQNVKRTRSHGKTRYLTTWVTLGSAGALLALATGLGVAALIRANDANDSLQAGYLTTYKQIRSNAKHLALAADISFGLAGGLAATSLVFYLLERHKPSKGKSQASILPIVGPGTVGLTTAWSF